MAENDSFARACPNERIRSNPFSKPVLTKASFPKAERGLVPVYVPVYPRIVNLRIIREGQKEVREGPLEQSLLSPTKAGRAP